MSEVKIKLYGSLVDILGTDSIKLEAGIRINEIKEKLNEAFPQLRDQSYAISMNAEWLNSENGTINEKDEIALLPPFAGG